MSRIFGSFAAQTLRTELAAVSGRQVHGGRDGIGVLKGKNWSLGCNRLAVTDPPGGAQPYRTPQLPGIIAVFDGEIYNHHELRRRLRARGHTFADRCDGTLLPALYAEYGTSFAQHLEGMFAVALVDARTEPRLVLATDDQGMKTLYHHTSPTGAVHFASELPGLLAFSHVPAEPRESGLDEYLTTRAGLDGRTILRGIRTLPPAATALAAGHSGLRVGHRESAPPRPSQVTGEAGLDTVLGLEMRRLAHADVPVASLFTDGLGAGLLTATAARQLRATGAPPLHSFHATHRGQRPGPGRGLARAVARRTGAVHHEVVLDTAELAELLPRTVWHLGQPHADPAALATYALFRAVRAAGFTVALTAEGADELFAQSARVRQALAAPHGDGWIGPYLDALAAVPKQLRQSLYTGEYRHYLRSRGTTADRLAGSLRAGAGSRLETLLGFETARRLPAGPLRRIDHLSAAWALEARMPYLQPSVTAFSRRLPVRRKPAGQVLHEAGLGLLSETLVNRAQQSAPSPAATMLAPGTPLMELARDTLARGRLDRAGRLDAAAVESLLTTQFKDPSPAGAHAVWALLVHELWSQELRALRPAQPFGPARLQPSLAA